MLELMSIVDADRVTSAEKKRMKPKLQHTLEANV